MAKKNEKTVKSPKLKRSPRDSKAPNEGEAMSEARAAVEAVTGSNTNTETEEVELDIVDAPPSSSRSGAFKTWLEALKQVPGQWARRFYKSAAGASGVRMHARQEGLLDEEDGWKSLTRSNALYVTFDPENVAKMPFTHLTKKVAS
jgi:hypothetical protein